MPRLIALAPCALALLLYCATISRVDAFASPLSSARSAASSVTLSAWGRGKSSTAASTKPTYNKQTNRWEPPADEDASGCYGPVGSLLRHGPSPFIQRLTNADSYEQAVLKYQASEGCSRLEAMGNMDAYFNNAADWAFQKNAEKNGAPKVDYTVLDTSQAIKTSVWGLFVTPFILRIIYIIAVTGNTGVKLEDIFAF